MVLSQTISRRPVSPRLAAASRRDAAAWNTSCHVSKGYSPLSTIWRWWLTGWHYARLLLVGLLFEGRWSHVDRLLPLPSAPASCRALACSCSKADRGHQLHGCVQLAWMKGMAHCPCSAIPNDSCWPSDPSSGHWPSAMQQLGLCVGRCGLDRAVRKLWQQRDLD